MSRFFGYYYLAKLRPDDFLPKPPDASPSPSERIDDWDKGALLIIAMVMVPVVAAVLVVMLLAV